MEANKLIGELLQSRDIMHLNHWKTQSLGEHQATKEYYEGVIDLIDSVVEKYFGRTKRIPIEVPASKAESSVECMLRVRRSVESSRENFPTDIQNILDEIIGPINETLYLLTLK